MDNLARQLDDAVVINGDTYTIEYENGKKTLLRYNKKYKVWMKLRFSDVSESNSIMECLAKQFIEANA